MRHLSHANTGDHFVSLYCISQIHRSWVIVENWSLIYYPYLQVNHFSSIAVGISSLVTTCIRQVSTKSRLNLAVLLIFLTTKSFVLLRNLCRFPLPMTSLYIWLIASVVVHLHLFTRETFIVLIIHAHISSYDNICFLWGSKCIYVSI